MTTCRTCTAKWSMTGKQTKSFVILHLTDLWSCSTSTSATKSFLNKWVSYTSVRKEDTSWNLDGIYLTREGRMNLWFVHRRLTKKSFEPLWSLPLILQWSNLGAWSWTATSSFGSVSFEICFQFVYEDIITYNTILLSHPAVTMDAEAVVRKQQVLISSSNVQSHWTLPSTAGQTETQMEERDSSTKSRITRNKARLSRNSQRLTDMLSATKKSAQTKVVHDVTCTSNYDSWVHTTSNCVWERKLDNLDSSD